MIRFNCFACKNSIKAPDGLAGKMGKCPRCGQRLRVPNAEPPPVVVAEADEPPIIEAELVEPSNSPVISVALICVAVFAHLFVNMYLMLTGAVGWNPNNVPGSVGNLLGYILFSMGTSLLFIFPAKWLCGDKRLSVRHLAYAMVASVGCQLHLL